MKRRDRVARLRNKPVAAPTTYLVAYGTVTFLVDADTPEAAVARVRHDCFDRYVDPARLKWLGRPLRNGPVAVREATTADIARHNETKAARRRPAAATPLTLEV